ncbi:hypothetical protein C1H46_037311 [Malus baccata]|uniref:RNase H type-1 domain-containing protein n=1 Tax=Malus baccata TaxID=106549 RepID=A0A540KSJ9_MALBA|nr:hypothetical protein C1H46_037311 [Malus baccata]
MLSRFLSSGHTDVKFITDIVISFTLAGRDTTLAALTWFFWLLSQNPCVENEILRQIDGAASSESAAGGGYTSKQAANDDVLPDATKASSDDHAAAEKHGSSVLVKSAATAAKAKDNPCNFDAAWDENGSYEGIKIVVRTLTRGFMATMVVWNTRVSSSMHAEAATKQAAAMFARHWSEEQVQVKRDALMVVAAIQNAGKALHGHFGDLFADTRHILQGFKQWKIFFRPRETNRVAHRLSQLSLTIDHPIS